MNTIIFVGIAFTSCLLLIFVFRKAAAADRVKKEARLRDLEDAPFGEVTDTNQKLQEMSEKYKNERGLDRINRFGGL